MAERAGGFSYADDHLSGRRTQNRNRFIYWRTQHDVLELNEISMDASLQSNCVRYRFIDAPILTVSITECGNQSVVVLVATVSSLHRINFVHPDRLSATENLSIFHDASATNTCDPSTFYVIGQPTSTRRFIFLNYYFVKFSYLSFRKSNSVYGHKLVVNRNSWSRRPLCLGLPKCINVIHYELYHRTDDRSRVKTTLYCAKNFY